MGIHTPPGQSDNNESPAKSSHSSVTRVATHEQVARLMKEGPLAMWAACTDKPRAEKESVFGFTQEDFERVFGEYDSYYRSVYQKNRAKSYTDMGNMTYIPLASVLFKMYGDDLHNRTIVEVGPGKEGTEFLRFFQSKGANVIGIDRDPAVLSSDDIVQAGELRTIAQCLQPHSADVIYVHHFSTFPFLDFNEHPDAETDMEGRRKEFWQSVAGQLDQCLKPDGVLMSHQGETDSVLCNPANHGYGSYETAWFGQVKSQEGCITLHMKK